ncbi:MAG TPA: transmembrane 220 family protein [Chryseosolibacter sp.]
MKITNLVLAVMFLLFAFVQINDPDPLLWIVIYGAMAAVCVMAAFRYFIKPLLWILLGGFIVYMVILIPGMQQWLAQPDKSVLFDEGMKMQNLYIEESREFLGLLICVLVLVMQLVASRKATVSA